MLSYDKGVNVIEIEADDQQLVRDSFMLTEVLFGILDYLPIGFLGLVLGVEGLKKWNSLKNGSAKKD